MSDVINLNDVDKTSPEYIAGVRDQMIRSNGVMHAKLLLLRNLIDEELNKLTTGGK